MKRAVQTSYALIRVATRKLSRFGPHKPKVDMSSKSSTSDTFATLFRHIKTCISIYTKSICVTCKLARNGIVCNILTWPIG